MNQQTTILERAYELARSGEFSGIGAVKARLKSEGYGSQMNQLFGLTLTRDLKRLCAESRAAGRCSVRRSSPRP